MRIEVNDYTAQEEAFRIYLRRVLPEKESVEAERMLDSVLSRIKARVRRDG